ncbi:MAG TPA: cytochrome c oxidase assembly protein, partial [Gemmatimonadales bacterium]|nr:cytochrome c oxidase assembly protein [Gemmatimonadales bacterium]
MTRRTRLTLGCTGLALLALALSPAMQHFGQHFFAGHMVQHELLLVVATPLLAGARLETLVLQWLPVRTSQGIVHLVRSVPSPVRTVLANPIVAAAIAAVVLWLWHLPEIYAGALHDVRRHLLQHAMFIGSGWWFWATVMPALDRRHRVGPALLALFLSTIHTSLLGAWLALGDGVVALSHIGPRPWRLTALE